jgi:DNA-binding IclR family transcriptional regulator
VADRPTSVDRALELLALFGDPHPDVRGLSELAAASGLDKATCYRYLSALCRQGLLRRDGDRYRLGFRLVELAERLRAGLLPSRVARPVLQELAVATGHSSQIIVRDGDFGVYAEVVEGRSAVRLYVRTGRHAPLYAGASTRLLLAFLPAEARARYLATQPRPAVTAQTVVDAAELERLGALARATGFSLSFGELEPFSAELAAPVRDMAGEVVAAVSVAGPEQPFRDRGTLAAYLHRLDAAAAEISRRLGHEGPWRSDPERFLAAYCAPKANVD